MIDDEKIIELFFERSEQAIRELDIKYGKICHNLSYNIVNSRQDAEECVNDAYLGAWNAIPPVRPNPLLSYIVKIVRNISLKIYWRKEAAKRSSHYTIALEEIEACIADQKTVEDETILDRTGGFCMNAKLFSEAMSEVNDKYYEEAANYHCKKHGWVKFTSLAACAAIVLAVSFATLWKLPSQTTPQPEYEPPIITNPDNQSDNPEQGISLNLNEIKELNATSGSIALMADDYTAMSYEELLRYFDVSLPITETLPYLTLQSNDFGIYQTDNRGIYYDGNFIEFRNSGGTQDINIVLSKVFKHTSDVFDLSADELQFTEINGRELAVFHYTNENGTDCYYAEFLQNDVAFVVSSENISMEDYAKCLQVLVEKAQQNSGSVNTITGEIVVIDPYANHIGVRLDKEQAPEYSSVYGIDLPDGQSAGDYSLGDRVEVMYTGEPATILTIWAEQLVDIKLLK